jgi:hypothetical protein
MPRSGMDGRSRQGHLRRAGRLFLQARAHLLLANGRLLPRGCKADAFTASTKEEEGTGQSTAATPSSVDAASAPATARAPATTLASPSQAQPPRPLLLLLNATPLLLLLLLNAGPLLLLGQHSPASSTPLLLLSVLLLRLAWRCRGSEMCTGSLKTSSSSMLLRR